MLCRYIYIFPTCEQALWRWVTQNRGLQQQCNFVVLDKEAGDLNGVGERLISCNTISCVSVTQGSSTAERTKINTICCRAHRIGRARRDRDVYESAEENNNNTMIASRQMKERRAPWNQRINTMCCTHESLPTESIEFMGIAMSTNRRKKKNDTTIM